MLHKRIILAVLFIIGCLPAIFYTPVYATTMPNVTYTSNYSIRQNPANGTWTQAINNYVGCVGSSNDTNYGTRYGIGIRFTAVNITQGATINSAYLVVTSAGNYSQDTVSSVIIGEDADNTVAITNLATYQSRRGTVVGGANDSYITTAYTSWAGVPHWTAGTQYASPDISDIIEEIVGRAGWSLGNNMTLFWDDHNAHSSQGSYVPPVVRSGSSYRLMVDYTAGTVPSFANITTKDATDVGSSSAVLNVYVDNDGSDPNNVMIMFGWSNATHPVDFTTYTNFSNWSTSNYSTGDAYYWPITGLTPSTTYYFNARGQNSAGNTTGTEQSFVTPAASNTTSPSNFIILPSTSSVDIQWTRPSGYSESKIYYQQGSIPTSNVTGTLLYSGTNTYYTHSGLTSGTTYGYRVYGYEGGTWSLSATGIITTKGTSTGTGLNTPTTPLDWFLVTDYTRQNQTFIYPIVNNLADSFSMPRNTAWITWALAVSMFCGFLVWSASRSMMALTAAVCIGILIGVAQGLLPKYMILLVLAFGISIIAVRERI